MIALRPATAADAARLLEWRNDPQTRRASFQDGEIDPGTHAAWLEGRLADPECALMVIVADGEPVGHVRLDSRGDEAVVSIGLAATARGRGLATPALLAAEPHARERGVRRLVAHVKPDNEPSLRAFRRAGYDEGERTADEVILVRGVA